MKQTRKTLTLMGETCLTEGISQGLCDSPVSMASEGDIHHLLSPSILFTVGEGLKTSSSHKKLPKANLTPVKRKHSIINVDNIALIRLLQKENEQLRIEKEEIKAQIFLLSERAKTERDEYIFYAEQVEARCQTLDQKRKKYKEKSRKYKEKAKNNESAFNETQTEFEEYKTRFNIGDQKGLKENIKNLKATSRVLTEENEKIKAENKKLEEKIKESFAANEIFKNSNSKLIKELEVYRNKVPENEEDSPMKANFKASLANVKKELKEALDEIEGLNTKQTEHISIIHSLKMNFSTREDELKARIRHLENELLDKNQEISELNSRLEEEISTSRKFERKTISVQEEKNSQVSKLAKDLQEIATEKQTIEQNYLNFQRKVDRNKTSLDLTAITKAEASITSQKQEIQKLQQTVKSQDSKLSELRSSNEKLLIENLKLKEHLNRLKVSKFSDPAFSALQERVIFLEEKNSDLEQQASEDKEKLNENIKVLEKQLEIVEQKKNDQLKKFEDKINSLVVENKLIGQRDRRSLLPGQFLSSLNEENLKQNIEMLNLKLLELKNENEKLTEEVNVAESKYQKSKMIIAKKEIEKENLQNKFRDAQEQMRDYCSQYTLLEVELYKINERFGKALNVNNQLENEIQEMKEQLFNHSHRKKKK
jgi:chromosome segregation ATPase